MKSIIPALAGLLMLGGCVSAGASGAVSPLANDVRDNARITVVSLSSAPDNVSAEFKETFEGAVRGQLGKCATGSQALTLEVTLDGFTAPNLIAAYMVPMASKVSGVARLRDAGGAVVGEYRIERSLTMGGTFGVAAAANAEVNMSNAFGEELCKQAFKA
ncbi:hypothetical protein [Brevundimonas lenta]|uniref:DUF4410 domain-containing protein n=1 Tax=Brevundimonas lenta TaxID=424796 RepID=A0A7W6JFS2_9CAUL|nr:hypothetical protein [Brevundimonas lenta]MBB4084344.1 hypothetical protein [Brevundimonas lenta]